MVLRQDPGWSDSCKGPVYTGKGPNKNFWASKYYLGPNFLNLAPKGPNWQPCYQSNNCRTATHALQYCLWRNKQNSFHYVITM